MGTLASLLVPLSCIRKKLLLFDLNRAALFAQVCSRGHERYERDPVDFDAPRGFRCKNMKLFKITFLPKVYEKFDYNDLECQKKLICEVMREPEYFGNMSSKLKSGFQ